jgi:hypothetical protein
MPTNIVGIFYDLKLTKNRIYPHKINRIKCVNQQSSTPLHIVNKYKYRKLATRKVFRE